MQPNAPPPWLVNMQRYGPPPSYPGLRIPGLNSPLPPGSVPRPPFFCACLCTALTSGQSLRNAFFRAQWGFHAGGWGKPPVDEVRFPLGPGWGNKGRHVTHGACARMHTRTQFGRPLYGDLSGIIVVPPPPEVRCRFLLVAVHLLRANPVPDPMMR